MKKRASVLWLSIGALVALCILGGCSFSRPSPTPARPTLQIPTLTAAPASPMVPATTTPAAATATPSATTGPLATDTAIPSSPTATAVPPTQVPATSTATAAPTALPPTSTFTPTPVPATKTPVPVTPTSTSTHTATPVPVITDWRGEYYANATLQGPSRLVRNDLTVDLTLPRGTVPAAGMPSENWSARWTRDWTFSEGNYRFHLLVDDGARLWVAGRLLIDAWTNGAVRELTADLYLKGTVPIRIEYYNGPGDARVRLNWEQVTQFQNWLGSYYPVVDLSGLPMFQRDDSAIDFNWGQGAPRADLPVDGFSVRWMRSLNFAQSGLYRFWIESDDGVRLWVDGQLVITAWRDGRGVYEGVTNLAAGKHSLQLDYYEHWGDARVQLTWTYVQSTSTPTSTPTLTPTHTPIPPTATSSPTSTPIPPTATPTAPRPTEPRPTDPQPTEPRPTDPQPTEPRPTEPRPTEPRPTETAIPPTPIPGTPSLSLRPDKGPIGVPFKVSGSNWPAGMEVDLLLLRPVDEPVEPLPVGQAVAGQDGRFVAEVAVPAGMGWEGLPSATLLARSRSGEYTGRATYRLQPSLANIKFTRIPADEERFALPEPAYLVLDSEEAWRQQFGPEPPPVQRGLDWRKELVVGAFLGSQPAGVTVDVSSIVQRDNTVSVWLTAVVTDRERAGEGKPNLPRVLVWVSRSAIKEREGKDRTGLVFAFLDASGRLLAQGPAGAIEPAVPGPQTEARALAVPPLATETVAQAAVVVAPTVLVEVQSEAAAELVTEPAEAAVAVPEALVTAMPALAAAQPADALVTATPALASAQPVEVQSESIRPAGWPWTKIGIGLLSAGAVVLLAALGVYLGRKA